MYPVAHLVRRTTLRLLAMAIVLVSAAHANIAAAQDAKPADDAKTAGPTRPNWFPVLQKQASQYVITVDAPGGERKATLVTEPLMRWAQPVRGGDDGVLCLWIDEGRPVVAMTVFTFKENSGRRVVVHEHQSLSTPHIGGVWRGRPMWHTTKPGLEFKPMPDAPPPAETPAARLRQMHTLSGEFSGRTVDYKGATWPLRVLAKPLHRYEPKVPELLDGALFAFAQGTDPEAFLLLEARAEGKDVRWFYAVARLTDLDLQIRLKDRVVFAVPSSTDIAGDVYQTKIVIAKTSDDPADFDTP